MNRPKIISIPLIAAVLLSGCGNGNGTEQSFSESNDPPAMNEASELFSYDKVEYIRDYDISDDGTLYALQGFPEADGSVRTELHCYSPDGSETRNFGVINASAVLWGGGKLYLTVGEGGAYAFNTCDPESGELTRLAGAEIQPENAVMIGDTIYYTGITEERRGMQELIGDTDFEYNGTLLYSYKLGEGAAKPVGIEYPAAIARTVSGELCVYAADESGPYFRIGAEGRKIYNNLGRINSFDFTNENNFVFSSADYPLALHLGRTDSNSIYAQLVENAAADRIKVRFGYVYYINGFSQRLKRISCSSFDKQNEIIRFLSPEYTFNKPFSAGYMTDYTELDNESFSLAVLSQDSSFDIFMINSYDGFSSNIRDKGSFYPLNDVPNVREYLDQCFPYLKEAATDADGNIWMLPIDISLPVIVYNKDACAKAGIDFGSGLTVEKLIELCESAYHSDYKKGYDIQPYRLTQDLFIQYMASHNSFDTPELRKFAPFAKEKINLSQFPPYLPTINAAMNNLHMPGNESAFLFSYLSDLDRAEWLSEFESFDFCAVPGITENAGPAATCSFITVNPSASNPTAALSYVSDLAAYLCKKENSFMLSERSAYTANKAIESVYEIVSGAEIGFNISEEIYFESYLQYLSGEISLEEFIDEADRRLSAYLNE